MSTRYFSLLILLTLFTFTRLVGQIRSEGQPVFNNGALKSSLRAITMPQLQQAMQSSDHHEERSKLKRLKYAQRYKISYSIKESGRWDTISDGRRVWRLKLSSPGAYSIGIVFTRFHLPEGAQLFLYSSQTDQVLGAYTSLNNKLSRRLAIEPLEGDEVIIEYIEPVDVVKSAELEIGELLHDYKNVFAHLKTLRLRKAGSCNVNINCAEGADWQREKNAVCHILYAGYIGSGALINNTRNDGKPYFLTANHTLGNQDLATDAIFFFNYESETCEGTTGSKTHTISGSTLRATTSRLDFSLVELSVTPPSSFHPYYAGWNRGDVPAENTTCIHHPGGDVKKISKDFDAPVTGSYNDGFVKFDANTHWKILRWDVGTTEGGSSGSPLFDQNHRIVGDLTGGDASCLDPVNDYYAKFSVSWDRFSDPSQQLKYWLDPDNTGVITLNGYFKNTGILAGFSLEAEEFCVGEPILITDQSQGVPTEYFWDFGADAVPSTASGKNPPLVSYSQRGVKIIKLTIRKDDIEDVVVKSIRIMAPIIPDFSYQIEKTKLILKSNLEDVQSIAWDFGDQKRSNELNPEHEYASSGLYFVKMTAENVCGAQSVTKEISTRYDDQFTIFPNPSSSNEMLTLDLSKLFFRQASWAIYDMKGAQVDNGILDRNVDLQKLDLSGQPSGIYILRLMVDGTILIRKIVLV
ncbi:MAG: PKD domain-containing protein [Marinifilaceae bacterium]